MKLTLILIFAGALGMLAAYTSAAMLREATSRAFAVAMVHP